MADHDYDFPEIDVLAEQLKADGISADDAHDTLMNRYGDRWPFHVARVIDRLWPEGNGEDVAKT